MPPPPEERSGGSEEDPFAHTRMSLGDHLSELRKRLIRGVAAVLVAFLVGCVIYRPIADVFLRPMHWSLGKLRQDQVERYERELSLHPELSRSTYFESDDSSEQDLRDQYDVADRPITTGFAEGYWFVFKIAMYFALAVGAPILLWELWQFIAAGLYARERRAVTLAVPTSFLLFVAGVLFGYFVLVPWSFYFLGKAFPVEEVQFLPRLADYLSLLSALTLALGLVFQLPLVMHVLVKIDLVQRATLVRQRAHFIVAAFVIAAFLTPTTDPFSQCLMAIPMVLLYELGLFTSRFVARQGAPSPGRS